MMQESAKQLTAPGNIKFEALHGLGKGRLLYFLPNRHPQLSFNSTIRSLLAFTSHFLTSSDSIPYRIVP